METPDRHWIDNHAGEACIGRNREPCSVIKDLPLLAMREVFLCHPDLGPRRHLAFSRQTGASMLCPRLPDGGFQESKRTPGIAVWEEDLVPRKTASERSLHATRARKLNHQPSHIDDWMYVKLAVLKINVNENRVKNAYSGGFLCEKAVRLVTAHRFRVPQSLLIPSSTASLPPDIRAFYPSSAPPRTPLCSPAPLQFGLTTAW